MQIRDWLYVKDHCSAIRKVLSQGVIGETYNIGGNNEKTNIELVKVICNLLDEFKPLEQEKDLNHYEELIEYVQDRPGHDRRYVIDSSKIQKIWDGILQKLLKAELKKLFCGTYQI